MAQPCVSQLASRAHNHNGVRWSLKHRDISLQAVHAARHRMILARAGRDYFDSPLKYMEQEMRRMDQDMGAMDREFSRMNRMMDRHVEESLESARRLQRSIDQQAEQAMQQAREGGSNIVIRQQEQRGNGSYSYYQSIEIRGSTGYMLPLHAQAPTSMASPLLLAVAVLTGMYAAASALFLRNYECTTYAAAKRWQLAALWPALVLFSSSFRRQFWAAMTGVRVEEQQGQQGQQG